MEGLAQEPNCRSSPAIPLAEHFGVPRSGLWSRAELRQLRAVRTKQWEEMPKARPFPGNVLGVNGTKYSTFTASLPIAVRSSNFNGQDVNSFILINDGLLSPLKCFDLVASEIKPLRNIKLISAFRNSCCGPGCHKVYPVHLKTLEKKIYLYCSHLSTPVRVTALLKDVIPQTFQLSSAVAAQKSNYCAAFPNSPENGNSVSVPLVNLGPNPKPTESIKKLLFVPAGLKSGPMGPF